jgi:hypothetical protein
MDGAQIIDELTEAAIRALHDFPDRIITALSEDEILYLIQLADDKIGQHASMSVPQLREIRKKLKAAQIQAYETSLPQRH